MGSDSQRSVAPRAPSHPGPIKRSIGRAWLALTGFRVAGGRPPLKKFVLIAAPHTSNWDLVHMLAMAWVLGMNLSWLGKHTLFEGPLGWLLRKLGGIAVDRRSRNNLVDQVVEEFQKADELVLAIPPEGTRKRVEHWRTGFYYIARGAGVPIVASVLDFGAKVGHVHPPFWPTGDIQGDLARLRPIYDGVVPKVPANFGPIQIRVNEAERDAAERARAAAEDDHARSNTRTSDGSVAASVIEG